MKYLKLIRFVNLIIIALTLFIFKWYLVDLFYDPVALSTVQFYLLTLATVCVAAAGYIINDIEDVAIDTVNKPNKVIVDKLISSKLANNLFIITNCIGIGIGFYISYAVGKPNLATIFVFASGLLYLYATRFKGMVVVSNIIVSFLTALPILLPGIFLIIPLYGGEQSLMEINSFVFRRLLVFAGFAFIINLLREIIKDCEDIDGDHTHGITTIPIVLGLKRTGILTGVLTLLIAVGVFVITYTYFYNYMTFVIYSFACILAPLLFIGFKLFTTKTKKEFTVLKHLYKAVMVTGIFSAYMLYKFVLMA